MRHPTAHKANNVFFFSSMGKTKPCYLDLLPRDYSAQQRRKPAASLSAESGASPMTTTRIRLPDTGYASRCSYAMGFLRLHSCKPPGCLPEYIATVKVRVRFQLVV
jgi:hypothetical protein